ncbi:MAG: DUF4397 domain-containing protein [Pseudonocardiales bacterium]|nr:DUF4397 domain-containing protein [Actinomycetota bacterium]
MNRATARLSAVAVAIVALTGIPFGAPANAGAPAAATAYLRGAHFSPDTAGVDVYLTAFSGGTSTLWLSDVGYGDVSGYRQMPPGVYAVSMRPHGTSATRPPVLSWTVNLKADSAYTAAAVGMSNEIRGVIVADTLSAPAAGTGLVRVIQASSQAGHASVRADNGPALTTDTAFGSTTKYVAVPSGAWTVRAVSSTRPNLSTSLDVSVASASITSLVLLDARGGGIVLRTVLDAAGASGVPNGSVPAGGGGMAPRAHAAVDMFISWAALACAALVLLWGIRCERRAATSRT